CTPGRPLLLARLASSRELRTARTEIGTGAQVRTHIQAGAVPRAGAEPRRGMGRWAGPAGLTGPAAHGWRDRITAQSSPVSRSVRSSPSVQSVTSRHGQLLTCAGIGPTPTENAGIGTIAIRSVRPNNNCTPPVRGGVPLFAAPTTIPQCGGCEGEI